MQAELVLLCIDGHGALAQFICRAHDANCNFTAVGNQNFFEVGHECSSYYAVAAFKARIPIVTNCFLSFYCQNSRFSAGFASVKHNFLSGELCEQINIYVANQANFSDELRQFGSYLRLDHPPTYYTNAPVLLHQ